MTAPVLDPLFPCLSAESAHPDEIGAQARLDELERILHARRDQLPKRVARGSISREEMDFAIDSWRALVLDGRERVALDVWAKCPVGADAAAWEELKRASEAAEKACAAFRWSELVQALQREIDRCRRWYPLNVSEGKISARDARTRLERLEAVHWTWWRHAHRFCPDELHGVPGAQIASDPASWRTFTDTLRAHRARFDDASPRGAYRASPAHPPSNQEDPPSQERLFA